MQIKKIQSNDNMSFGYNTVSNAQLMKELSRTTRNKAYYEYLRNLLAITNQTETQLVEAEIKGKSELAYKLIQAFVPVKLILIDLFNSLFPKLKYRQNELEAYSEEIKNLQQSENDVGWRNYIVSSIKNDIEKEAQEKAMNTNGVSEEAPIELNPNNIMSMLSYLPPGAQLISISRPLYPQNISEEFVEDNVEETDEEKIGENSLSESIELGKSKVVEYKPTKAALKGFDGLGGMKELKAELTDKVVDFLKNPEQAKQDAIDYGTKLPGGLLFYGPPGCGKTTIVEHLSTEANVPLLKLETGTLKTAYYHGTSTNIDAAFDYAQSLATPEKPVIVMIDDADSFFIERSSRTDQFESEEMTTFLNRIQDARNHNVIVAITTNKYDIMDPAIKRRFDCQFYVGLPDEEARKSLLEFFLKQNAKSASLANNKEVIDRLAKNTSHFPISAIKNIVADACDIPKKEAKEALKLGKTIRRNVTEEDINTILEKPETQNLKIKEQNYKSNATQGSIGFHVNNC